MILAKFTKQPHDRKDYDITYHEWLPAGDQLDGADTVVTCLTHPGDDSLVVDEVQVSPTTAKLWVSGGAHGRRYKVTVQVVTAGGRRDESEVVFVVKDF